MNTSEKARRRREGIEFRGEKSRTERKEIDAKNLKKSTVGVCAAKSGRNVEVASGTPEVFEKVFLWTRKREMRKKH